MRSDIIDEYFRIAQQKGWVKEDINKTAQDSSASTRTERMTKDYKEKIQSLYGVIPKEDTLEALYEKAHPEKVIIAPSYDKLNGLVENLKERQDIMIGVINRPMTGALTQHRYAKELINDLVKTAFEAEAVGNYELAEQADECLKQVVADLEKKNLNKKAIAFLLPFFAALVGGSTVIGGSAAATTALAWVGLGAALYYAKNAIYGHFSRGLESDFDNLYSTLTKAISYSSPENDSKINSMLNALNLFKTESQGVVSVLNKVPELSADNIKNNPIDAFGTKPNYSNEEVKALEKYISFCQALESFLNKNANHFRSITPEQDNSWYSFFEGSLATLTGQGGYNNLISAIATFNGSLKALYSDLLKNLKPAADAAKQEAGSFLQEQAAKPASNPTTPNTPAVPSSNAPSGSDLSGILPDEAGAIDRNYSSDSRLSSVSSEIEDAIEPIASKHRLGMPGTYSVQVKINNDAAIVNIHFPRLPEDKQKLARELSEEIKPVLSRKFKNISSLKMKIDCLR